MRFDVRLSKVVGQVVQWPAQWVIQGDRRMKVKYFADTDTALVEFTDSNVVETKAISEDFYVDLDQQGESRQHDDRACPSERAAGGVLVSGSRGSKVRNSGTDHFGKGPPPQEARRTRPVKEVGCFSLSSPGFPPHHA